MKSNYIFVLILICFFSGCTTTKFHSTRAILFKEHGGEKNSKPYKTQRNHDGYEFSGNPVYVAQDAKFSIRINAVYPAWLRQEKKTKIAKVTEIAGEEYNKLFPREIKSHIRGKELWLLTTISSLDPKDPLEVNSKRYFKATNVKFDAQSYALIPLDLSERYVFTHDSDSSFRVKFQLFSVEDFAIKKALAKAISNKGISGLIRGAYETLKETAISVVGEELLGDTMDDKAAFERLLLTLDATEEFYGEIVVLRSNNFQDKRGKPLKSNYDKVYTYLENNIKDIPSLGGDTKKIPPAADIPSSIDINYVEKNYLLVDVMACLNEKGKKYTFSNKDHYKSLARKFESAEFSYNKLSLGLDQVSDNQLSLGLDQVSDNPGGARVEDKCSKNLSESGYVHFSVSETPSATLSFRKGDMGAEVYSNYKELIDVIEAVSKVKLIIAELEKNYSLEKKQSESFQDVIRKNKAKLDSLRLELNSNDTGMKSHLNICASKEESRGGSNNDSDEVRAVRTEIKNLCVENDNLEKKIEHRIGTQGEREVFQQQSNEFDEFRVDKTTLDLWGKHISRPND